MKITVDVTSLAEAVRAKHPHIQEEQLKNAIREYYAYRDQCVIEGQPESPGIDKILECLVFQMADETARLTKKPGYKKHGYIKRKNGRFALHSDALMQKVYRALHAIRSRGEVTLAGFAREMNLGADTTVGGNRTRSAKARRYLERLDLMELWKNWVKAYGCRPQKQKARSKAGSSRKNENRNRMIAD